MTKQELIKRAIMEGIFEADGFRYVCREYDYDNGIERLVKRISLESLNRQYEEELKSADEITGWETIATEIVKF